MAIDVTETRVQDLCRKVRSLRLRALRPVRTHLAGAYASVFRGPGIAFEELRHYEPGNDVRAIDWHVTARFGRPFVKRFVEERELCVLIVMDVSASMDFGSGPRTKREAACEAVAALALTAALRGDRVGGVFFGGKAVLTVKPRRGERHALRVLREALYRRGSLPATDVREPLRMLSNVRGRGHGRAHGTVFLLSDMLFDPPLWDPEVKGMLCRVARLHDLVAISVRDPGELRPGSGAVVECSDAESGQRTLLDLSKDRENAVRTAAAGHVCRIGSVLAAVGASRIRLDPQGDCILLLQRFFRGQNARQGRIKGT